MKKTILLLSIFILALSSTNFAEDTDLKPQTVCPVLGNKIDKNVFIDYQGQRIYFCCPSCKETFLKEPEKYMKKIAEDKVLLESVQKFCPVMTEHSVPCLINKNIFTDYEGRRVYFCSTKCKKIFLEDPEKYLKYLGDANNNKDDRDRGEDKTIRH